MPYKIDLILFDLGVYTPNRPGLSGILDLPALGAPFTATSTMTPFSITFASPPNPPGSPGTLLLTDPSGPGDYFRSGPIATWPPEPLFIQAGAAVVPLTFAALSAGITTPISTGIPWGIAVAVGAAMGFMFTPFNITITRVVLGPSPTPGAIRARLVGTIGFLTLFIPRRTDFTGTVDLTITPSGNAAAPATIVNVSTSNLSLSTGFTTPLSTGAIVTLAPLFSVALSGPVTTSVNASLARNLAALRAMLPTRPDGTPLFSAAATASARRITVLSSGLIVHGILAELVAGPATTPIPVPTPTDPEQEEQFVVTIEPQPEFDVAHTYFVHVRKASDSSPVENATVTIGTFTEGIGRGVAVSGQTDVYGVAVLEVTLRTSVRPSTDPTKAGQLEIIWPVLSVMKTGFQTYREELSVA
jgi:hypothetical protein